MQPNRRLAALLAVLFVIVMISCNQESKNVESAPTAADQAESKKIEVVKSFYPSLEKGDWSSIEKIMSADFADHNPWTPPSGIVGRDSVLKGMKEFRAAFPDLKFEVMHTAVDGDMVFVHYRFTGSNDGPFMGMPATNKKIDYTGVDLIRMKDTVAAEHWDYGDNVTYMKQMGLMP
jgi:predicted ester cyclase